MTDRLVERYLRELDHDLRGVPRARRRELLGEIRDHIDDALPPGASDEATIRTLLDQLGEPSQIADEARDRFGAPTVRAGAMEIGALLLLPVGGIVIPGLGWVIGVILLWSSRIWNRAEKVAATLLIPGGLALPFFLILGGLGRRPCGLGLGGETFIGTCGRTSTLISSGLVALLIVAPVAMTVYLGVKMRSRSQPSAPPQRGRWLPAALVALASLIAVSAVIVVTFLANFVPLRANTTLPSTVGGDAIRLGSFVPPSGGPPFTAFRVPYRNGEAFEYGFVLYNNSPFDVTVEQVGLPGGSTLRQVGVRMAAQDDFPVSGAPATSPFRAFSIPPHHGRFVLVQFRFTDCNVPTVSTTARVFAERVEYRFFGLIRREFLPLGFSLNVFGNEGCATG